MLLTVNSVWICVVKHYVCVFKFLETHRDRPKVAEVKSNVSKGRIAHHVRCCNSVGLLIHVSILHVEKQFRPTSRLLLNDSKLTYISVTRQFTMAGNLHLYALLATNAPYPI